MPWPSAPLSERVFCHCAIRKIPKILNNFLNGIYLYHQVPMVLYTTMIILIIALFSEYNEQKI